MQAKDFPINVWDKADKAILKFFFSFFGILKKYITFALPNKRCRVGQGVKTPPFHGGITGSIPVRGTKAKPAQRAGFLL